MMKAGEIQRLINWHGVRATDHNLGIHHSTTRTLHMQVLQQHSLWRGCAVGMLSERGQGCDCYREECTEQHEPLRSHTAFNPRKSSTLLTEIAHKRRERSVG